MVLTHTGWFDSLSGEQRNLSWEYPVSFYDICLVLQDFDVSNDAGKARFVVFGFFQMLFQFPGTD
jgi:hypothetical protein